MIPQKTRKLKITALEFVGVKEIESVASNNKTKQLLFDCFIPINSGAAILVLQGKVVIILEQREVAFLSPRRICENLNFSTEIQIFANFPG